LSSLGNVRAIIAVDLDYFYAQCEEVRDPSIKEKPVVICVFSGRTEDSGAVSTSNYLARKLGVRSGMPIVLAKRILKTTPGPVFLPMDMEYYESVSERIMELIRSKGDKFEQSSIDEAYLDVTTKDGADFQIAKEIGTEIKAEILSIEKLTCTVGVGQNKLMAKMAVDSKKPDEFTVILQGSEKAFLAPLPVGKLFRIGPKTEEKLRSIGIVTVGELAVADRTEISNLFGKNLGPDLIDWANGIDESPVLEKAVEQMSRIVTLKNDVQHFDFREALEQMSKSLSEKLRSSRLACRSIGIIAITTDLKVKSRSKSIAAPTQSSDEILQVSSGLFTSFFEEQHLSDSDKSKLRRVGIRLSELIPYAESKTRTLESYFK